ncbi:MAG: hypothetical protein AAF438_22685 [Pseudomonadota bacterium]
MPKVSETIPTELQPQVDAAVSWFNQSDLAEGETFKVTGILDADDALSGSDELRLILCGGDRCEQHTFSVSQDSDAWAINLATSKEQIVGQPQAELDPPPGPRLQWIDDVIDKHAFTVLLFYRGFW